MTLPWIEQEIARLSGQGLMRDLRRVRSPQGPMIELDGKEVVNFCANDYLGLASDHRLILAAHAAAQRWGSGAGASRLIAGDLKVFEDLERELARLKGTRAALLFSSGYMANTGLIPALAGEGDSVFSDSLNHASIIDGCRLSRASTFVYRHNDPAHLEELLARAGDSGKKLVVTESLFSMEGDLAPLPEIMEAAKKHKAMLMIDDAHATGVLGDRGSGALEHFGIPAAEVEVIMGTLGKALGSAGAFVCGTRGLIRYLVNAARTFVFTTGPSPAAAGAAMEATRIVEDEPWRRERVKEHAQRIRQTLAGMGRESASDPDSPIVPVVLGDRDRAMQSCEHLLAKGVFVQGIRPPTVPEGTSRLRITLSAAHEESHIQRLLAALPGALA